MIRVNTLTILNHSLGTQINNNINSVKDDITTLREALTLMLSGLNVVNLSSDFHDSESLYSLESIIELLATNFFIFFSGICTRKLKLFVAGSIL